MFKLIGNLFRKSPWKVRGITRIIVNSDIDNPHPHNVAVFYGPSAKKASDMFVKAKNV